MALSSVSLETIEKAFGFLRGKILSGSDNDAGESSAETGADAAICMLVC